jgi:hypothetical protein
MIDYSRQLTGITKESQVNGVWLLFASRSTLKTDCCRGGLLPSEDSLNVTFQIPALVVKVGWHGFVISYCVSDKFSLLTVGAGILFKNGNSAPGFLSPQ